MPKSLEVWLSKCLVNGWNPLEMKYYLILHENRHSPIGTFFFPQGQARLVHFFLFVCFLVYNFLRLIKKIYSHQAQFTEERTKQV